MGWEFVTVARVEERVWIWPSSAVDQGRLAHRIAGGSFEVGSALDPAELVDAFPFFALAGQPDTGSETEPETSTENPECLIVSHPAWRPEQVTASVIDDLIGDGWEIL